MTFKSQQMKVRRDKRRLRERNPPLPWTDFAGTQLSVFVVAQKLKDKGSTGPAIINEMQLQVGGFEKHRSCIY